MMFTRLRMRFRFSLKHSMFIVVGRRFIKVVWAREKDGRKNTIFFSSKKKMYAEPTRAMRCFFSRAAKIASHDEKTPCRISASRRNTFSVVKGGGGEITAKQWTSVGTGRGRNELNTNACLPLLNTDVKNAPCQHLRSFWAGANSPTLKKFPSQQKVMNAGSQWQRCRHTWKGRHFSTCVGNQSWYEGCYLRYLQKQTSPFNVFIAFAKCIIKHPASLPRIDCLRRSHMTNHSGCFIFFFSKSRPAFLNAFIAALCSEGKKTKTTKRDRDMDRERKHGPTMCYVEAIPRIKEVTQGFLGRHKKSPWCPEDTRMSTKKPPWGPEEVTLGSTKKSPWGPEEDPMVFRRRHAGGKIGFFRKKRGKEDQKRELGEWNWVCVERQWPVERGRKSECLFQEMVEAVLSIPTFLIVQMKRPDKTIRLDSWNGKVANKVYEGSCVFHGVLREAALVGSRKVDIWSQDDTFTTRFLRNFLFFELNFQHDEDLVRKRPEEGQKKARRRPEKDQKKARRIFTFKFHA